MSIKNLLKGSGFAPWLAIGIALACGFVVVIATLIDKTTSANIEGSGVFASNPIWDYVSPDNIISSPLVQGEKVYVRTSKSIQVLDSLTGSLIQSLGFPGRIIDTRPPVVYQTELFVPGLDGQLAAYNTDSLQFLWKGCPAKTNCGPPDFDMPVETITYSQSVLVVTRHSDMIYTYDAKTGNILWVRDIPDRVFVDVAAKSDVVYAVGQGNITAYDLYSGIQEWDDRVDSLSGRLLVHDSNLYLVTGYDSATRVLALDLNSKRIIWTDPVPSTQVTVRTFLAIDNNILIVASDSLTAIDVTNGKKIWESDRLNDLEQPLINNGIIFVRNWGKGWGGTLFAFDLATGKLLGTLSLRNVAPRSVDAELNPAVDYNLVIVPIDANRVVAFKLK